VLRLTNLFSGICGSAHAEIEGIWQDEVDSGVVGYTDNMEEIFYTFTVRNLGRGVGLVPFLASEPFSISFKHIGKSVQAKEKTVSLVPSAISTMPARGF